MSLDTIEHLEIKRDGIEQAIESLDNLLIEINEQIEHQISNLDKDDFEAYSNT